jgi:hypothetical protein
VRDRTPDNLYFLIGIMGSTYELTTDEYVILGQRLMSLDQFALSTVFLDFATMQAVAADRSGLID